MNIQLQQIKKKKQKDCTDLTVMNKQKRLQSKYYDLISLPYARINRIDFCLCNEEIKTLIYYSGINMAVNVKIALRLIQTVFEY